MKQKLTLYFTCILFKRNNQTRKQTKEKVYCTITWSVYKIIAVVLNAETTILEIKHV